MNYTETLEYLFTSLPTFQQVGALAYKPGLERVSEFCRKIGNPQRSYFTIHIALFVLSKLIEKVLLGVFLSIFF